MIVRGARFVTSAADPAGWPPPDRPEVCFAGRSNVGKSSLMNRLMDRRDLVKVSSTPGKTRLVNFFDVELAPAPGAPPAALRLADLPGYGYARVSLGEREAFARLAGEYLDGRESLRACVLLLDPRRAPGEEEVHFLAWLRERGLRFILVATKCDKLPRTAIGGRIQSLGDRLGVSPGSITPTSAAAGDGRDAAWRRILAACR